MVKSKSIPTLTLRELTNEDQKGPLDEAIALADMLDTIAVDKIGMREGVEIVLCRMLCERLDQVKSIIDAEVAHG